MSTKQSGANRMEFIDVARGFAVIFMIWWHTAHSWLEPSIQQTGAWTVLRTVGGLAAPLFVMLAGVGVGLQTSALRRKGVAARAITLQQVSRGLQVVLSGYGLRLFLWAVDGGGLRTPAGARVWLPLTAGYLTLYVMLENPRGRRALVALVAGAALIAVGFWQVGVLVPNKIASLARVDVLQAIGASIVLLGLLGAGARLPAWAMGVLAIAVAVTSEAVGRQMPGPLPEWLAGYLAKWAPPPGARPMTLFPQFPWLAYAAAGAAVAGLLDIGRNRGNLKRTVAIVAAIGALVAVGTLESFPHMHKLFSALPSQTVLLRVLHRVAWVCAILGLSLALAERIARAGPLITIGRASMFVYWVHMEFAFGLLAAPVHGKLGLYAWCVGFVLLCFAMWAAAWFRLQIVPQIGSGLRHIVKRKDPPVHT